MRKHWALALIVVGLVLTAAGFAGAAAASVENSVTFGFTLATHETLTVHYDGDPTDKMVTFADPIPGVTKPGDETVTLTVQSNHGYTLRYLPGAAFTDSSSNTTIPIARMSYHGSKGTAPDGAFSPDGATLDSNHGKTSGETYTYSYSVTLDWLDDPGTYTGTVVYQVTP